MRFICIRISKRISIHNIAHGIKAADMCIKCEKGWKIAEIIESNIGHCNRRGEPLMSVTVFFNRDDMAVVQSVEKDMIKI